MKRFVFLPQSGWIKIILFRFRILVCANTRSKDILDYESF